MDAAPHPSPGPAPHPGFCFVIVVVVVILVTVITWLIPLVSIHIPTEAPGRSPTGGAVPTSPSPPVPPRSGSPPHPNEKNNSPISSFSCQPLWCPSAWSRPARRGSALSPQPSQCCSWGFCCKEQKREKKKSKKVTKKITREKNDKKNIKKEKKIKTHRRDLKKKKERKNNPDINWHQLTFLYFFAEFSFL